MKKYPKYYSILQALIVVILFFVGIYKEKTVQMPELDSPSDLYLGYPDLGMVLGLAIILIFLIFPVILYSPKVGDDMTAAAIIASWLFLGGFYSIAIWLITLLFIPSITVALGISIGIILLVSQRLSSASFRN